MKKTSLTPLILTACLLCGCSNSANLNTNDTAPSETTALGTNVSVSAIDTTADSTDDSSNGSSYISYKDIKTKLYDAGVSVHDPSIFEDNGTFYIFGTHMATAKSTDLSKWTYVGNGYTKNNPVYDNLWAEDSHVFDYSGSKNSVIPTDDGHDHVWAPDVIYNKTMDCYMLYYCTSSTWNASNLCYATSDNVEGPYTWQGALIYSGFTEENIDSTDVLDYVDREYAIENYTAKGTAYNYNKCPNALDPTVFYDEDDRLWMVYGSWSGGIYLLELDATTGKVIHPELNEEEEIDPYFGKRLIGGSHKSIEGPYIVYDKEAGYYYLFVSYGSLIRTGGYQIRVFRSETVDGTYVDMNGNYPKRLDPSHNSMGLKLSGNYILPSVATAYMATGHNSAMITETGERLLCYHTRFDNGSEYHEPRVKQYLINEDGWPCLLPYRYQDAATEGGLNKEDVCGDYYFINQGTQINYDIATPVTLSLNADGSITATNETGVLDDYSGSWELTTDKYITITYSAKKNPETTYHGVLAKQLDEAGVEVTVFSAVGNNASVWGVKYEK